MEHEENVKNFIFLFSSIIYEAFPFVVLGSVIAGFLEVFVPQKLVTRVIDWAFHTFNPRIVITICIGMSALLGIVFPMCECGIIPVMRRLLRKGLPLSCCVAYILAGPIINPVVMMSTFYAFKKYPPTEMGSFWMVFLRCAFGYVVACVTAGVVHQLFKKYGYALMTPLAVPPGAVARAEKMKLAAESAANGGGADEAVSSGAAGAAADDEDDDATEGTRSGFQRVNGISETALHDFIDIMVYLVIGAAVTSFIRLSLTSNQEFSNPFVAIPFTMMMAVLMCLCSEADAFVAANFAVPAAAKLAFLVLGPMLDLKLYLMYTRVFRNRLIWTIITCVVLQTFVYCLLAHFAWQRVMVPWLLSSE